MLKSHIIRRANQDAALCIPMYEQSRVINAIFPELSSFKGGIGGISAEVVEAYAVCVQVQTVLFDSHVLLSKHLAEVYSAYREKHPIRYWFIGDVVPLDRIAFVARVDALYKELLTLKKEIPVSYNDVACLRSRIRAVQSWLGKMVKLNTAMSVALAQGNVAYLSLPSVVLPHVKTCSQFFAVASTEEACGCLESTAK